MSNQSVFPVGLRLQRAISNLSWLWKRFAAAMLSWRTLVCVVGILAIVLLFSVAIAPVRYDISVGMVPPHTITANRDVVDEVTTEAKRAAAAQAVQPTYHYVDGITENVLAHFDQVFDQLDAVVQYSETLEGVSENGRYTPNELEYARSILTLLELRDYQLHTLFNTPRQDLTALRSTLYTALQNTMSSYVTEGLESEAVNSVMQIVGYRVDTSLLQNVVLPVLRSVIRPNMLIDQAATAAARQLARESVDPVIYKQGQNILVKGEGRVERYQYEMLSSLGLLNNATVSISMYLGAALLVVLSLSLAMVLLRILDGETAHDYRRLLLLYCVLIFTLICCILMRLVNIYLSPVALAALLLSATIGLQAGVIFNVVLALLTGALAAGGSTSYTSEMVLMLSCSICSGTAGAMILHHNSKRLCVIYAGVAVGACNFLIMLALGLMTSTTLTTVIANALWCMGGGLIAGALCIAAQPLLEAVFNLPTMAKLMELSNPNHPLLRRLLLEAPGTYHHSIVVANLAEAAAEAIGANPLLARVGGYYHDVGKLRRPQYFKENQLGGENRLTETDPYTAAQIVISHARDGATLARNYHLPREVIRIIQEHHGNTPVMYFYSEAVKEADGQPVDADAFRYDAAPPSTKEGAIVMLCDTIEAAVRSMQNPTPDTIEDFIVKLVRGKLQDGQLSNSPLTLKDIDSICHASATVLNGVFHERIEYPDPPAHIKPAGDREKPDAAPQQPDEALVKPWDGYTEEKETPMESTPPLPVEAPELPPQTQQILIDPSEFIAEEPLPVIEPPTPEAPVSIEKALTKLEGEQEPPSAAERAESSNAPTVPQSKTNADAQEDDQAP